MRHFLALVGLAAVVGCVSQPPAPQRPTAPPAQRPVPPPGPAPGPSAAQHTHRVQPGETLWSIARQEGVTVAELKQANGLTGDSIFVGQELVIPRSTGRGGPTASSGFQDTQTGLSWPVPGLKESREDGEALLIYAPEGTSVVAAASGRVNYLSPGVRGLGAVAMVEHGGGLVTVYGNLGEVAVALGQVVRRGDPLGRVGPGDSGGPRLRFMVFKDGKAVPARGYVSW
jgi:murein DD-endopeptidase MepM/ murein hydrolase activator NlpD